MRAALLHGVAVLLLTVLTQVGGAIYVLALLLRARLRIRARPALALVGVFIGLYVLAWAPVQGFAALLGRQALPCVSSGASPLRASVVGCALHRHYAADDLVAITHELARDVAAQHGASETIALDANFPFFDGFPLIPHLSHDDGRKLDLAFYYAAEDGAHQRGALRSPLGYWAFEAPQPGEPQPCADENSALRWDMAWFQPLVRDDLVLDEDRTRAALRWLADEGARRGVAKVFVEPHLARRLGVSGDVIRFQGCHAARHDDHMHIQLR